MPLELDAKRIIVMYCMPMPYTPIVATLGYVIDTQGNVLLVHRNRRSDDQALGKMNGLGGKMERGEDAGTCIRRELLEEAQIHVTSMHLRGTVNWPGFGKNGEDWFGFIFIIDGFTGDIPPCNDEGDLIWVPLTDLLGGTLPLWPGDQHFLPLVFDTDTRVFHGVMPYEDGHALDWSYSR